METKKLFSKYYKKLANQGIIKSLMCGLLVGMIITLFISVALWFFDGKMFYLAFIGIIIGIATTPLFYKFVFKPTTKAVANKIDELGLEERMITMTELEGDESYMACRQREDAIKCLGSVSEGLLKLVVSVPLIIALIVTMLSSAAITTVNALAVSGIVNGGGTILDPIINPIKNYTIEYNVEGDGEIEGDIIQNIESGKDGSMVTAVALPGNVFYMWSDGLENPVRYEYKVKEDIEVTAIFIELEEDDESDKDGEEGNEDGDPEGPKEPKPGEGENGDGNGGAGVGGNHDDQTRKWGDGKKDLGDHLDQAREDASKGTEGKDSDTKKKVDDYFNGLN